MVLIVKTDTATNTIRVFDESGNEKAEIVSIPGKDGKDGASGHGRDGRNGTDGRNAPSLEEIVSAVVKELTTRMIR
jgi:hypothetical protein